MSKHEDFVRQALAHYEGKLSEETEQFGVLGCSDEWIENNSRKIVESDTGAGTIWEAISEQSGMVLHVDYAPGNPQCVYAVLSKTAIPRPGQYYELWLIVEQLKGEDDLGEKIESLEIYDGPYKLELPEDLFED